MTAKEFLSQAFYLDREIAAKRALIRRLRDRRGAFGASLDRDRVQGGKRGGDSELTDVIVDVEAELESDIKRLAELAKAIKSAVDSLDRPDLRIILTERYLNMKRWEDIADGAYMSLRSVYRRHSEALKKLALNGARFRDML